MSVKHDNVTVQLTGQDGNAFAIIAAVASAIRREVGVAAHQEYVTAAMDSVSYDALLAYTMETVHVV